MRKLGPAIARTVDARSVKPPVKTAEPFYLTPRYRAWREAVVARAGRRCEHRGCRAAEPWDRMFADHVIEIRDGGAEYDLANGMCLCGRHHSLKTMQARARRLSS